MSVQFSSGMASLQPCLVTLCLMVSSVFCQEQETPRWRYSSCLDIKQKLPTAASGQYKIYAPRGLIIEQVYCEMGLGDGGYTFLHPSALRHLTNDVLQQLFVNKTSFLMRLRKTDGTQPYAVLRQLPQYRDVPLKLSLNSNTDYNTPVNAASMSQYIYFGFLPQSRAATRTLQGLQVNSRSVTFTNCDANPNNYLALFPNFAETTPSNYAIGTSFPFCNSLFSGHQLNPSHRVMPSDYFMFLETHWGGCGCYSQTDTRLMAQGIISAAIGFR